MSSRASPFSLLIGFFASCAPHSTIADGTSDAGSGGASGTKTGGTGPTGGTSNGTTSSGGTAGSAIPEAGTSTGGTGNGNAGGGPPSCDHPLPDGPSDPDILCNYRQRIANYCSKGGCHGTGKAGGLDLRITGNLGLGFISRLVDQPALHEITCVTNDVCVPTAVPTACSDCSMCPVGDKLLDSANIEESWVLKKLAAYMPPMSGTTNINIMCGAQMPSLLTTGITAYAQADKDCLVAFFRKIAKTEGTFPCGGEAAGQ